jgi:TRAP-type C4-dicarboxylate transport system substrate-binding protein
MSTDFDNHRRSIKEGRMKKCTMLLSILVVLVFAATGSAKTIKLRYAQQNPDTGWSTVHCVEPWLKKVEAATNGKVQIQAFHGQTLAKGKDMWNAVKSGITDIETIMDL